MAISVGIQEEWKFFILGYERPKAKDMQTAEIKVDECLIMEAQLLKTGANNHTTDQFVLMYRGAAKQGPVSAFEHFERALRDHVQKLRVNRARRAI